MYLFQRITIHVYMYLLHKSIILVTKDYYTCYKRVLYLLQRITVLVTKEYYTCYRELLYLLQKSTILVTKDYYTCYKRTQYLLQRNPSYKVQRNRFKPTIHVYILYTMSSSQTSIIVVTKEYYTCACFKGLL